MTDPTPPQSPLPPEDAAALHREQRVAQELAAAAKWGQAVMTEVPAPAPAANSRKHLIFGVGGLTVGLVAGLLLGALGGAVNGALAGSHAIPNAVEKCAADQVTGVDVMDQGKSLNLRTAGKESEGTNIVTAACVLTELKAPDSFLTRLSSTRALDGTQSGEWAGFTASWTYHPDNGLNVVVETAAK